MISGRVSSDQWQVNRVTLADGQYGVVCYFFDTTRLQQAYQAVRESEERLRFSLQAASAGAWEWDILSGKDLVAGKLRSFRRRAGYGQPEVCALGGPDSIPRIEKLRINKFAMSWRGGRPSSERNIELYAAMGRYAGSRGLERLNATPMAPRCE